MCLRLAYLQRITMYDDVTLCMMMWHCVWWCDTRCLRLAYLQRITSVLKTERCKHKQHISNILATPPCSRPRGAHTLSYIYLTYTQLTYTYLQRITSVLNHRRRAEGLIFRKSRSRPKFGRLLTKWVQRQKRPTIEVSFAYKGVGRNSAASSRLA